MVKVICNKTKMCNDSDCPHIKPHERGSDCLTKCKVKKKSKCVVIKTKYEMIENV